MDVLSINKALFEGKIDQSGIFPHLDQLKNAPFVFTPDFGLDRLPTEPGVLFIRGARQYGKSTWLESALKQTIVEFGPGSAFYLNGDMLLQLDKLAIAIEELATNFRKDAPIKRIFIDEITAIPSWEVGLKRVLDSGSLRDILVITTGSNATDIRRGSERLPGRKGKLARTTYLFNPISFKEFQRVCGAHLQEKTFIAYLLSGGSPIACTELAQSHTLPEYVIELTRDWIDGEVARSGRTRQALNNMLHVLYKFGGTAVGQAKLAREANFANNTMAAGYAELLNDLGVLIPSFPFDMDKNLPILRKPCKFHVSNLLAGFAYSPNRIRSLSDFSHLPESEQGMWLEWLIAQEQLRRTAINGESILAPQFFWQNKSHEIDFVLPTTNFLEVKRGGCNPFEFTWFAKQFPGKKLIVLNKNRFETEYVTGMTIKDYLLMA